MNLVWTENAWEEYRYWQSVDKKLLNRINDLIKDIKRSPFHGIGKPEPLKFDLTGHWSRKIDHEHRLVYRVAAKKGEPKSKQLIQELIILQCRYHY